MKKLFYLFILASSVLTSCSTGGGTAPIIDVTPPAATEENVSGLITANTTWTANKIWILNGKVVVNDGVTLTIEAGTIIKGKEGSGSLASALIVARGGKLNAVGTADKPIIFTSIADNIKIGEKVGTNLTIADNSKWGGLLILGKAKGSFSGDVSEFQIEGIPASDFFGLYGGSDDADNSGHLEYLSIRHGGAEIGAANEINGLTLGAVGSATIVKNIEIMATLDDGIEIFGGAVNISNIIVWGQGDDGLDVDQGWNGSASNALVILTNISDSALEIDGGEGSLQRDYTLTNISLKGDANAVGGKFADFRSAAQGTVKNLYAYNFQPTSIVRINKDNVAQNYVNGKLIFTNWQMVLPTGITAITSLFKDKSASLLAPTFSADAATWATPVTAGSQTTGADISVFSWTIAKNKSAF